MKGWMDGYGVNQFQFNELVGLDWLVFWREDICKGKFVIS
jgi:hypothetical protein